jgi:hypothetical protein
MLPPAVRIQIIEGSLDCFHYGLVSLLPLIGVPFLLLANVAYRQSRIEPGEGWNPARRYRRAGHALLCLGGFIQFLALGAVVIGGLGLVGML